MAQSQNMGTKKKRTKNPNETRKNQKSIKSLKKKGDLETNVNSTIPQPETQPIINNTNTNILSPLIDTVQNTLFPNQPPTIPEVEETPSVAPPPPPEAPPPSVPPVTPKKPSVRAKLKKTW